MHSQLKYYNEVKLENGKLVDRIKNHSQKDWITACERLGLFVVPALGKGSHCAVYKNKECPPEDSSCCVLTIPKTIYPNCQRDFFKKVLLFGKNSNNYTEEDIWKALDIKI